MTGCRPDEYPPYEPVSMALRVAKAKVSTRMLMVRMAVRLPR